MKAGRLTQAQADAMLANAKQRLTDLVNGTMPDRGGAPFGGPPGAFGSRHDHGDGPI